MSYWLLLAATVVIETPIAAVLARRGDRLPVTTCALFLNLFTHPLATLAVIEWQPPFAVVEFVVFAAEALGFRLVARQSWARALIISAVANGATVAVSLAL